MTIQTIACYAVAVQWAYHNLIPNLEDQKYWLGFSLVPEIGPKRLRNVLAYFGDPATAWFASERDLHAAGLTRLPHENLLRARQKLDLDAEINRVKKAGARLLTPNDAEYPELLRELPDAPIVLYILGTIEPQDQFAVAIVGTRKATSYGRDAAQRLSQDLVQHKMTVISGLAQGIDAAAHRGAIEGKGRTIAVLGSGIDIIYPTENRALAEQIIHQGAIISEFPIGTSPEGRNFPQRNRLISGMSLGTLIVEAPKRSGALITAHAAAEQGRDVFAVPGSIFSKSSGGTNHLIQDGAKLVTSAEDILNELNIVHTTVQTRLRTETIAPENETEAQLLQHLSANPIHIDDLTRLCGMPVATVSSTLTILELKGLAKMVAPMQYSLTHPH